MTALPIISKNFKFLDKHVASKNQICSSHIKIESIGILLFLKPAIKHRQLRITET